MTPKDADLDLARGKMDVKQKMVNAAAPGS
jgi:hypothetical protein